MAISDNYAPDVNACDGATTSFSGDWKVLNASYFRFALEDVATGVQTLLTLGSDYTLTFGESGYVAITATAYSSAYKAVRYREVALDQTDPYRTSKGFQGKVIEDSFDKLTAIEQDQNDQIGRSFKVPVGEDPTGFLPSASMRALKYLAFDASGNPIASDGTTDTPISSAMEPVVSAATLAAARAVLEVYSAADMDYAFSLRDAKFSNGQADGRLTLTSGVPVTTSDVTAATTLYYTPYVGNKISLYSDGLWNTVSFTEKSIAVPAVADKMYDVFAYNNNGILDLELLAWTNDTTRATALARQDGVLVKNGDPTRRFLGVIRTLLAGQTEVSKAKMCVANEYNAVPYVLNYIDAVGDHTYTTATWRLWGNSSAAQLFFVVPTKKHPCEARTQAMVRNTNSNVQAWIAVGDDATGVGFTTEGHLNAQMNTQAANTNAMASASRLKKFAEGYHFVSMLEYSASTGTTTFVGGQAAITAEVMG